LRSAQGQAFGKQVLMDRIKQLDDIQRASSEFPTGSMGDSGLRLGTDSMVMSNFPQAGGIELNLLLQSIIDSTRGGDTGGEHLNRLDMANCYKAITLIFRTVPRLQNDEITDILAKVDLILTNIQGLIDPDENTTLSTQTREIALSLDVLFTKLKTYLEKMMETNGEVRQRTFYNPQTNRNETQDVLVPTDRGTTMSLPERAKLSSALVTSLGFSKMLRFNPSQYDDLLSTAERERLMTSNQRQTYLSGDYGVDGDGGDQDDDDRFDRPARAREDTQHEDETGRRRGGRPDDFDEDERETFATQSGSFYDQAGGVRGQNAYMGEEAPELEEGEDYYNALEGDERAQPLLGTRDEVSSIRRRYLDARNEERTRRKREMFGSQASSTVATETTRRTPSVFSQFDPDTQGFNVGYRFIDTPSSARSEATQAVQPRAPQAPRRAPSVRSARSAPRVAPPPPAPAPKARKSRAKAPEVASPPLAPIALPKKISEVPSDMGTLLRIANSAGIRVNRKADGSYGKASNIRRNIILKLGLAGKR
jgi:hypothetical protein